MYIILYKTNKMKQTAMQEMIKKLEEKRDMWKADGKLSDRQIRGTYVIAILIAKELLELEKQQQDEFAIGFADWIRVCKLKQRPYDFDNIKELLEIYKDEKDL